MAIGVIIRFESEGEACPTYDTIVDEMKIQNDPPRGSIYHWAAATSEHAVLVADLWQSGRDFQAFVAEKMEPLTTKHHARETSTRVYDAYRVIEGRGHSRTGVGVIVRWHGDPDELANQYDEVNEHIGVDRAVPEGLILHWSAKTDDGFVAVDHWTSRAAFDVFAQTKLGPASETLGLPMPDLEIVEIHNTIDPRVAAAT